MAKKSSALPVVDEASTALVAQPIEQPSASFEVIALEMIDESPTNPRKTFGEMTELRESIRRNGVLQPVLVRPREGRYELVFGHRRLRAAIAAGRKDIPAFVREMDDLAVLESQLIENAQRSDIHPLEEADGFKKLHVEHGKSAEEIAAKTGKSTAYVYSRMKLAELVGVNARLYTFSGKISPSIALLIARLNPEDQDKAALKVLDFYDQFKTWEDLEAAVKDGDEDHVRARSYREAVDFIAENFELALKDAPFDIDDAELFPVAGACATCPKRTINEPNLFQKSEEGIADDDRCTDSGCFNEKKRLTWYRLEMEAEAKGGKLLNEKRGAKVLEKDGKVRRDSGYVAADAVCADDKKKRTWRELTKDGSPKRIFVKGPKKLVEIFEIDNAVLAASIAGNEITLAKEKKAEKPSRGQHYNYEEERKKEEAKRAKVKARSAKLVEALTPLAREALKKNGAYTSALLLAMAAKDFNLDDRLKIGLPREERAGADFFLKQRQARQAELVREMVLLEFVGFEDWNGNLYESVPVVAKKLGIDFKKIEKEVDEAIAEGSKPALKPGDLADVHAKATKKPAKKKAAAKK